jgi:hypothetical protein
MNISEQPLPIPQFYISGIKVTKTIKGWLFSTVGASREVKLFYVGILRHIHKSRHNTLWDYLEKEGFTEAYPTYESKQRKRQKIFVQHVTIINSNFSKPIKT